MNRVINVRFKGVELGLSAQDRMRRDLEEMGWSLELGASYANLEVLSLSVHDASLIAIHQIRGWLRENGYSALHLEAKELTS